MIDFILLFVIKLSHRERFLIDVQNNMKTHHIILQLSKLMDEKNPGFS